MSAHDEGRLYALDGVRNFRDFGGYPTRWGGRVARGALFRAGHFADATEGDIAAISALGVRLVCDLRRPEERSAQPSRWPGESGETRVLWCEEGARDEAPHVAFLKTGDLSPGAVSGFMRGLYRQIPYDGRYVRLFSDLLGSLAEGEHPIIVHCAAGKDRTGILCALILMALEVPDDAVMADFELTNRAVDLDARLPFIQERFSQQVGRTVPRESVLPLLGVDASYLRSCLDTIERQSGGVKAYLRDVLGFDWAAQERLRERLVT